MQGFNLEVALSLEETLARIQQATTQDDNWWKVEKDRPFFGKIAGGAIQTLALKRQYHRKGTQPYLTGTIHPTAQGCEVVFTFQKPTQLLILAGIFSTICAALAGTTLVAALMAEPAGICSIFFLFVFGLTIMANFGEYSAQKQALNKELRNLFGNDLIQPELPPPPPARKQRKKSVEGLHQAQRKRLAYLLRQRRFSGVWGWYHFLAEAGTAFWKSWVVSSLQKEWKSFQLLGRDLLTVPRSIGSLPQRWLGWTRHLCTRWVLILYHVLVAAAAGLVAWAGISGLRAELKSLQSLSKEDVQAIELFQKEDTAKPLARVTEEEKIQSFLERWTLLERHESPRKFEDGSSYYVVIIHLQNGERLEWWMHLPTDQDQSVYVKWLNRPQSATRFVHFRVPNLRQWVEEIVETKP